MNKLSNISYIMEEKRKYLQVKIHHLTLIIVLIGSLNWGAVAFGYNIVDMLKGKVNTMLNRESYIDKIIYLGVALAAIKLVSNRTTWLPFLGESVLPGSLIPMKENIGTDTTIKVKVSPNARVAYWASLPSDSVIPVNKAYGDFSNSGVVLADDKGFAELKIKKSNAYTIPSGKEISKHVHYRELDQGWGMVGDLKTEYY